MDGRVSHGVTEVTEVIERSTWTTAREGRRKQQRQIGLLFGEIFRSP